MGEGAIWGMNEKREETESSPTTNCRLLQLLFFFVDFFLVLGWRSFQFVKKLCV